MNEGKPTPDPSGRPAPTGPEGDFELERPAAPGAPADGARAAGVPGDTASPAATGAAATGTGADVAPSGEGDFELRRPEEDPAGAGDGVRAAAESAPAVDAPLGTPPDAGREPVSTEDAVPPVPAPGPAAVERPRPLHDPDPYSTPPYGEPGPWAPAPPVQHPAATPSHGTHLPVPQTAHGAETQVPAVPHGAEAPAPAPAAAGPDSAVSPPPGTSIPGTSIPGTAPVPADPWRRYDPWAAGPLQQMGEAVPGIGQRRRRGRRALVLGAVLLALVSGGVGGAVGTYLERNGGVGGVELPQAGKEPAGRAPDSVAGIAARALPSVVTLHVRGSEQQGTGTGFVLDDRGHILTNNHVVEPAGEDGEITVTFHSGDTAEAELIGRDSGYDLAVVRVKGVSGLEPAPLGNSDNVQVGDPVVAIGAPFDLAGTVTSGIISAKQRPITAGGEKGDGSDISYVDALQTDAPINPGNSGGPLLDTRGRVIGINSAIRSAGGGTGSESGQSGSIGLGFAIPVNQGKRVAEELINTGRATHPVIGVTLDMDYSGDGARVGTRTSGGRAPVTPGGAGDRAGVEAGDVITAVDGQRIHSGEELIVKTRAHRPGDRLELTVERNGRERTISLVLGSSDDG